MNPGCFSRNLIKYPCVVLWGTFLAVIVLGLLPVITGAVSPALGVAVMLDNMFYQSGLSVAPQLTIVAWFSQDEPLRAQMGGRD